MKLSPPFLSLARADRRTTSSSKLANRGAVFDVAAPPNARSAAFIGSRPDGGTSLTSVIGRALPHDRGKRLEARAPIGREVRRAARGCPRPPPRRAHLRRLTKGIGARPSWNGKRIAA